MTNFITNEGASNLKKRLLELIKHSEELKFLVGFFYFSGIRELYEGLKENPDTHLKILVGLNIDQTNYGLIEYAETEQLTDEEKTYKFFESIKTSLNTENYDTQDFYGQFKFFLEMIHEGRLIIRKTYKPNHAKLYFFTMNATQVTSKKLFITGSSNLTSAGISTQEEFNVQIRDYGLVEAEAYFDDLWNEAVEITENDAIKKQLIEVIENESLVKDVTPFEAYCLVLKTYLDSFEQVEIGESITETLQKNGYKKYQYQLDAVKQALAIIENNNGVIIADVVGLGKTIIACAIAKQLKKRGVVICPPGLVGDKNKTSGWKKYIEEFGIYDWEVRSLGDLDNILEFVRHTKDIEVVIIDEAHRFRNQDTQDYEILKNICREKQVILLTATPFNNRPADILALLKLFIIPKKSSITLESNLVAQFQGFKGMFDRLAYIRKYYKSSDPRKRAKAEGYYKAMFGDDKIDLKKVAERARYLAGQIRNVIEPVTIRRNRLDIQNNPLYNSEVKELSKVDNPQEWFFALSKEQSTFYTEIIEEYFGDPDDGGRFKGAIYKPFEYEKGVPEDTEQLNEKDNRQYQQQRNLYDFMRRMIVKRFESSFGAFRQSIMNFKEITSLCQKFIIKTGEYILDRSLLEKIYTLEIEEIEKCLEEYEERIKKGEYPKNHQRYIVSKFKSEKMFRSHIESDIRLFDEIIAKLDRLELVKHDPKSARLIEKINAELAKKPAPGEPKRKIIIFSEYTDTVKYLEKALEYKYGARMLIVAGSLSSAKADQIYRNFDASHKNQENEFDILLATDKISEGFNLNRAGMVINYDIPWNPVRVIQRLGRINRISKKVFNELFIVNFFPTEQGAETVQSREIAANKMFLIHTALGEDSKIFDIDEEPTPAGLFQRVVRNPDIDLEESFYTRVYKEMLKIEKQNPGLIDSLKKFPPRIKVAKQDSANELMVFFKKGRLYVSIAETVSDKPEPRYTSLEEVFEKIKCKPDEASLEWNTDAFWRVYQEIQDFRDFRNGGKSEQSLEPKALNKLEYLLKLPHEHLLPHKDFLRMLKEDILNFGTLADFTLRRIAELKEDGVKGIEALKHELGENYLSMEKKRQKEKKREIIIAIENKCL